MDAYHKNKLPLFSPLIFFTALFFLINCLYGEPGLHASVIEGCPIFPGNNIWNTPVDTMPVDPNSETYITTIGPGTGLHPDFGSGTWNGGPIGIPYIAVPGTQARVSVSFDYADESDPGPYPIPPNPPIEGGENADGDRHVLVLEKDSCTLYELWSSYPNSDGSWSAGSGAVFNLRSNILRPDGWTSADAAGLPVLPGLVRYDEVAGGEIAHAIRFTVPKTRRAYVWPARHYASSLTGSQYPPMGQRFRLKSSFDASGFSQQVQVILRAMKKYGITLADNGSAWYFSGVPDERWDNDTLVSEFRLVKGSDFEAVDVSSLMINPDSGQARASCTSCGASFSDVPSSGWAIREITAIACSGITLGCGDGAYCPGSPVTRNQMAAFLVRAKEGEPSLNLCETGSPFGDVSSADPYCRYIRRLSELNITQGCGEGMYCPGSVVTREQMAAFLVRAVSGEPSQDSCITGSGFSDVPPESAFCRYIRRLSELNITQGCGEGMFCPGSVVTREQMAAFLYRAFLRNICL